MSGAMATADVRLPVRLLAGGGPSSPDPRVLAALTTPLIGQFDLAFTSLMDDVMQLARQTFLTTNERCYAISAQASGGLEAVLNSLLEDGDGVAVGGSPAFVSRTAETARCCGAQLASVDDLEQQQATGLVIPFIDPWSGQLLPIADIAAACHARGLLLIVEATHGLAAVE